MKKTLTINISGTVFQIDEDAYERLHDYLEGLKSHFRRFPGQEEIIADIEGRISEILQGKISPGKQVINIDDIIEVISMMGQPEEFDSEEDQADSARQDFGSSSQPKRLYRDPDQKIIGGVCSGIASYFMIDPIWVRIIFLVLTFSGFGILLYIILWIAVPEARTTAERLEMRGKPVNVNTIEQSIKEEVNHLKVTINDLTGKAKDSYQRRKENFNRNQRSHLSGSLSAIVSTFLRLLMILAGFVIFVLGLALTFTFLAVIFRFPATPISGLSDSDLFPLYSFMEMIFHNDAELRTFITGLIVIIGITLFMMLWGGIRLLFNLPRVKFISSMAVLLWICGLVITAIFGLKTYRSFHYEGEFSKNIQIEMNQADTVRLLSSYQLPEDLYRRHNDHYYIREWRMVLSIDEQIYYGIPQLRIRPSEDSTASMSTHASARGAFPDEAELRAEAISYDWRQSGNSIIFPDSYRLAADEKWRKQELKLDLYIPAGTIFSLDEKLSRILAGHPSMSRLDMAGKTYIMEKDGMKLLNN